jgi:voltage-dependent potassium channel beta subunit
MGAVLKALRWPRMKYVVSTKFYWGMGEGPNEKNTLNRKYLMQAMDGSLRRFGLDHIDLIYCHRPDPHTPIEETVRAMSDLITQGKALYWGTSEWPAADVHKAWEIAERHHLHKPVVEQPQYHLFHRHRVEQEYAHLYDDIGLGLTTWSPLASGLLSGKYRQGIPADSRAALDSMAFLRDGVTHPARNAALAQLEPIAAELGGNLAQLALAWCTLNPRVSSVITGASKLSQLQSNLGALALAEKLTPQVLQRIEGITAPLAD